MSKPRKTFTGFTLAELLISLAILGVIATFSIPKILTNSQNEKSRAIAKEAAGMVSEAFQKYKATNTLTLNTTIENLTPYMNYVSTDTSGVLTIDGAPNGAISHSCGGGFKCLRLHNGATFFYSTSFSFCTSLTSNTALFFFIDPDGIYSGSGSTADGPSRSVVFWLYPDGKIRTFGSLAPNTQWGDCSSISSSSPTLDPSWFNW